MASTPAQDAEEADESEVTLEVRLQWQDAGGSQSDQICMVATSTLKELREHCAEMLKVKRIHCPDFNDDMGSQQLQELGIGAGPRDESNSSLLLNRAAALCCPACAVVQGYQMCPSCWNSGRPWSAQGLLSQRQLQRQRLCPGHSLWLKTVRFTFKTVQLCQRLAGFFG